MTHVVCVYEAACSTMKRLMIGVNIKMLNCFFVGFNMSILYNDKYEHCSSILSRLNMCYEFARKINI